MKNGWLGFSKHSYSSKHFYILSFCELLPLPRHNHFRGVRGNRDFRGVLKVFRSDRVITSLLPIVKIAYDEIIFVRSKGAEAEHSTPM